MADYKVHRSIQEGENYLVNGVGISVTPTGSNNAGLPWTAVAAEYTAHSWAVTAGEPPFPLTPAIEADARVGTKIIWTWAVSIPVTATNQQAVAAIEAEVAAQETIQLARLRERLRYWGFTGST